VQSLHPRPKLKISKPKFNNFAGVGESIETYSFNFYKRNRLAMGWIEFEFESDKFFLVNLKMNFGFSLTIN